MNVSACLVTRGDVDMQPVIDSIPQGWEIVVWDNGEKMVTRSDGYAEVATDLSVYGRYAAIEYASHELIYVQDDDCAVSDPAAIVGEWDRVALVQESDPAGPGEVEWGNHVVCNMPQEFRHDFYDDHALVGFGAAFHRDAPLRAFARWWGHDFPSMRGEDGWFNRTCDVVFTALTPRVLVDVPKENREMASAPNRMWKQQGHQAERARMLKLARMVRDH